MKTIEQTITLKIKIKFHHSHDSQQLWETMVQYQQACNTVSQYIFNHDFELKMTTLHHQLYHQLREDYHLKSQLAISAVRTTIANYRTVQTQLKQQPYHY